MVYEDQSRNHHSRLVTPRYHSKDIWTSSTHLSYLHTLDIAHNHALQISISPTIMARIIISPTIMSRSQPPTLHGGQYINLVSYWQRHHHSTEDWVDSPAHPYITIIFSLPKEHICGVTWDLKLLLSFCVSPSFNLELAWYVVYI